jgi:hypothetical protein
MADRVTSTKAKVGLAAAGLAATFLGVSATSAHAAPSPSSIAVKLKTEITRQLKVAPGGKAINDHQVSYKNGSVIATMPSTARKSLSDCPDGWFCVWTQTSYAGSKYQFHSPGYWQNLADYGISQFWSLYDHRSNRVFVAPFSGGGADQKCFQAGTRISNTNTIYWYSGIYLGESNNKCGT